MVQKSSRWHKNLVSVSHSSSHRLTTLAGHTANDQSLTFYHEENVAYHQTEAVMSTQDQAITPYQEYDQYEEDQQYQAADQNFQMQGKGNKYLFILLPQIIHIY